MAILETISETITSTGKEIAGKTKEIGEIGKLKSKISLEEKEIRKAYFEIGKLYYESAQSAEGYEEYFTIADEAHASIKAYRAEINEIRGVIICTECGNPMAKENLFCGKCGAKLPVVETAAEEEVIPEEIITEAIDEDDDEDITDEKAE